jgi:tellurite resistance protein TerC
MTSIDYQTWHWVLFFSIVLTALFVDIGIVNRKSHAPTRKETVIWATVWVSLALGFNVFLLYEFGLTHARLFFTGYLIELSLSVDNLFVFLLIFSYFRVPKAYQHRVLFWGIMGALVMRMIMIFAGVELVNRFEWIIYIFGAFLLYTGLKMFRKEDESFDPTESWIVRFSTRFIRISKEYNEDKFFVRKNGVRTGTLLLLVLIVVEFTDLIFAVDSIPAIFGITTDRYIIYTSNIFAILGLRTFFFLLADIADRFHYLRTGLAFILSFIGVKMLLPLAAEAVIMVYGTDSSNAVVHFADRFLKHEFKDEIVNISLSVVVLAIASSIVLSLLFPPRKSDKSDAPNDQLPGQGQT